MSAKKIGKDHEEKKRLSRKKKMFNTFCPNFMRLTRFGRFLIIVTICEVG